MLDPVAVLGSWKLLERLDLLAPVIPAACYFTDEGSIERRVNPGLISATVQWQLRGRGGAVSKLEKSLPTNSDVTARARLAYPGLGSALPGLGLHFSKPEPWAEI